jgi:hypothetical protein
MSGVTYVVFEVIPHTVEIFSYYSDTDFKQWMRSSLVWMISSLE